MAERTVRGLRPGLDALELRPRMPVARTWLPASRVVVGPEMTQTEQAESEGARKGQEGHPCPQPEERQTHPHIDSSGRSGCGQARISLCGWSPHHVTYYDRAREIACPGPAFF